jgi:transcription elongation factor Elf1
MRTSKCICPHCDHNFSVRIDTSKIQKQQSIITCPNCKNKSTFAGNEPYYLVRYQNESKSEVKSDSIEKKPLTEQEKEAKDYLDRINSLKSKNIKPKFSEHQNSPKATPKKQPNSDYVATPVDENPDSNVDEAPFTIYAHISFIIVGVFILYTLSHYEQGLNAIVNVYFELDVLYSRGFWVSIGRIVIAYIVGFIVAIAVEMIFKKETVFFRLSDGIIILGVIVYTLNFFSVSQNDNMHEVALVKAQILTSLQNNDCSSAEKHNEIYVNATGRKPNLYLRYVGECFKQSREVAIGEEYIRQFNGTGDPNGALYFTGNEE